MLNTKLKLKAKGEMRFLVGTAAFLFLNSVAQAQTLPPVDPTEKLTQDNPVAAQTIPQDPPPAVVPQITANSNSQFTPNQYPDPWAFDALNNFSFQASQANLQEGTDPLTGSLVSWESTFSSLLQNSTSNDTELTLVYKIANRTIELAQSLNENAQKEISEAPPNYQIAIDRAIEPMLDVYHHGANTIDKIKGIDNLYYLKSLRRSRGDDKAASIAEGEKKLQEGLREYVVGEIEWFRKTFLVRKINPEWIGPKYSEEVYYTVLDNMLQGIIEDLTGSNSCKDPAPGMNDPVLFPSFYANSVSQLRTLEKFVRGYRNGNRTLANTNYSFIFVNQQLNQVLESLK